MEATRPDDVPDAPMRTRFCMVDGEPRAFTNSVERVGGTHKGYKRLFSTEGLEAIVHENDWKRLLLQGRITPLGAGDPVIELVSDCIGEPPDDVKEEYDVDGFTPQEALKRCLQNLRVKSMSEGSASESREAEGVEA